MGAVVIGGVRDFLRWGGLRPARREVRRTMRRMEIDPMKVAKVK